MLHKSTVRWSQRFVAILLLGLICVPLGCGTSDNTPLSSSPTPANPTTLPSIAALQTTISQAQPTPTPAVPGGATTVTALALPSLTLPLDEAKHNYKTEWWYYTGHLQSADGKAYGFEFVIFQFNLPGYPTVYTVHYAITDHQRKDFFYTSIPFTTTVQPGGPGFNFNLGGWQLQGNNGHYNLHADSGPYAITLKLDSDQPVVVHGDNGIFNMGTEYQSYYYSRPQLSVQGTINDHGNIANITGTAWMDKQWGDFFTGGPNNIAHWDWYSIVLTDGEKMMLYIIHDPLTNKIKFTKGTYIDKDNHTSTLTDQDISLTTLTRATMKSGNTYANGWQVTLPEQGLNLKIAPVIPDQELVIKSQLGNLNYWEGEVTISGTKDNKVVNGNGYVELTDSLNAK